MKLQTRIDKINAKDGKELIIIINEAAKKIKELYPCSLIIVEQPNINILVCDPIFEGPAIVREYAENFFGTNFFWIN